MSSQESSLSQPSPERPPTEGGSQEGDSGEDRPPRRALVALVLVGLGAVFAWSVYERDFWSDELRVATVVREMSGGDTWWVPTFGGRPELSRPPLVFWLSALAGRLPADPLWTYRAPVLVVALVSVALTWALGRRLFGARVALLAMLLHGSTYLVSVRASWLGTNMIFATFCQISLAGFAVALGGQDGWRRWAALGWCGLAGAAMADSILLGPLLVFGSLCVFLVLGGGPAALVRGCSRLWFVPGLLLAAVPLLAWYALAYRSLGAELFAALPSHLGVLPDSIRQVTPLYHQLVNLLWGFLPWTVAIPLGLYHVKDRVSRPGERLCLAATLFPLLLLSALPGKDAGDLLFVWPYLALAIAAALRESGARFSVWETYLKVGSLALARYLIMAPLAVLAVALALLGIDAALGRGWALAMLSFAVDLVHGLPAGGEARLSSALQGGAVVAPFIAAAVASATAFAVAFRAGRRVNDRAYGRAAIELACAALCLLAAAGFSSPIRNDLSSSRQFVERLAAEVGASPLAIYGTQPAAFYYYLRRVPEHIEAATPASRDERGIERLRQLTESGAGAYVVAPVRAYELLERDYPSLTAHLKVVDRGYLGWREAVVLLASP